VNNDRETPLISSICQNYGIYRRQLINSDDANRRIVRGREKSISLSVRHFANGRWYISRFLSSEIGRLAFAVAFHWQWNTHEFSLSFHAGRNISSPHADLLSVLFLLAYIIWYYSPCPFPYRRYSYFLMGTHSRTGGSVFIIPYVPKSLEENLTLVLHFRALSKPSGRSPLYSRSFSSFELYIRFIAVSLFIELAREVYGGAKYRGEYGPEPFIICRWFASV